MKKCPFCAEEIQDEAIKCRHCGSELSRPMPARDAGPTPVPQVSAPADTSLIKKQIGCGPILAVVLAFFVAVGIGISPGIMGVILFVSAIVVLVIYRQPATTPRAKFMKTLAVSMLFGVLLGYASKEGRTRRTPTSATQAQSTVPVAPATQPTSVPQLNTPSPQTTSTAPATAARILTRKDQRAFEEKRRRYYVRDAPDVEESRRWTAEFLRGKKFEDWRGILNPKSLRVERELTNIDVLIVSAGGRATESLPKIVFHVEDPRAGTKMFEEGTPVIFSGYFTSVQHVNKSGLPLEPVSEYTYPTFAVRLTQIHEEEFLRQRLKEIEQNLAALSDGNVKTRRKAAKSLSDIWGSIPSSAERQYIGTTVPVLRNALKDPDGEVRRAATKALGNIGPAAEAAVEALVSTYKGADSLMQAEIASTLGQIGPAARKAVPTLQEALNDPDEDVRNDARAALQKILPGQR